MKYQHPHDLIALFNADGRLTIRSESCNVGAKVPAIACSLLSFCSKPKSKEDVLNSLGPHMELLFQQLIDIGLLCPPEEAAGSQMFHNFSDINVHRKMLNDHVRLNHYRQAIQKHVQPGMVVIDAGAGSGILSVYAALSGASRVYAIESNEFAQRIANIAEDNGVGDIIQVVQADFGRVTLPEKADVLVTETFGAWALAEGAAADLKQCVDRNLKNNGTLLPETISFFVAPLATVPKELLTPFGEREDQIDLSHLLPAARRRSLNLSVSDQTLQGQCISTLSLLENTIQSSFTLEQECQALALWFDLHFDDNLVLSTNPKAPRTHWKQTVLAANIQSGTHQITVQPANEDRRGCTVQIGSSSFHIR